MEMLNKIRGMGTWERVGILKKMGMICIEHYVYTMSLSSHAAGGVGCHRVSQNKSGTLPAFRSVRPVVHVLFHLL